MYVYNESTFLYSRNDANMVNQLYFNKTLKNEKKKREREKEIGTEAEQEPDIM